MFTGNLRRFDGTDWLTVGGGVDEDVRGMVEDTDGSLIVGGRLVTAGGVTVNRVARWDGANWSALGSGFDDQVNAVAFGPDGALYAGGFFAGSSDYVEGTGTGTALSGVARWNGATWEPLGPGLDGYVRDLAVYDGKLLVIGKFKLAGSVELGSVATWDGTDWAAVGDPTLFRYPWGSAIQLSAVAVQANGFFLAGTFADIDNGGDPLTGVAWWNGSAFVSLGGGTSDVVEDVVITPDGRAAIVGGAFTAAGNLDALSLARWEFDDQVGTVVTP